MTVESLAIAADTRPVTVITGGSEGLGLALAHEFAKTGHRLLLVARNEAKLSEACQALQRAYPIEVFYTAQDLATEQGCAGVEAALREHGLHADYLVNNAGLAEGGFFQDADRDKLLTVLNLNARAVVDLSRRLLRGMLARGRGGILNVGSMTGFMPTPYEATYAATKAFLLSFSRSLSYECMWTGVTVSALMPGVITTALHEKAGATYSRYLYMTPVMSAEQVARIGFRQFMRGKKIIVPGLLNRMLLGLARFTPYFMLVPVMGFLFRVLDENGTAIPPRTQPRPMPAGEDDPSSSPKSDAGAKAEDPAARRRA